MSNLSDPHDPIDRVERMPAGFPAPDVVLALSRGEAIAIHAALATIDGNTRADPDDGRCGVCGAHPVAQGHAPACTVPDSRTALRKLAALVAAIERGEEGAGIYVYVLAYIDRDVDGRTNMLQITTGRPYDALDEREALLRLFAAEEAIDLEEEDGEPSAWIDARVAFYRTAGFTILRVWPHLPTL